MCSKKKHLQRSHCTYKRRMAAARWYCNYSETREERKAREALWKAMFSGARAPAESENK